MTFCLYLRVAASSRFFLISFDILESQEFVYSHNFVWFKFYCMNKHPCISLFLHLSYFLFHFVQLCYKSETDFLAVIISFFSPSSLFFLTFWNIFPCPFSLFGMSFFGGKILICNWTLRSDKGHDGHGQKWHWCEMSQGQGQFIYATLREYRYSDKFKSIYTNLWAVFTLLAIKNGRQGTEDTEIVYL